MAGNLTISSNLAQRARRPARVQYYNFNGVFIPKVANIPRDENTVHVPVAGASVTATLLSYQKKNKIKSTALSTLAAVAVRLNNFANRFRARGWYFSCPDFGRRDVSGSRRRHTEFERTHKVNIFRRPPAARSRVPGPTVGGDLDVDGTDLECDFELRNEVVGLRHRVGSDTTLYLPELNSPRKQLESGFGVYKSFVLREVNDSHEIVDEEPVQTGKNIGDEDDDSRQDFEDPLESERFIESNDEGMPSKRQ
ncbi:hypothetical protein EVAR_103558_1 [Eumeta japonica]|uniref:Uncharacterized protein n=1 Tax=Eumeta variegata TaxID=151549 RepID=A0A4C1YIA9_EUMVA|nr:hypothetical protein EVAR_103558_1 [Eumeta japonica]